MRVFNVVTVVFAFAAAAFATPAFAVPGEVVNVQWCIGSKTCLQWNTEPAATQYRLYRGERASFPCLLNPSVESCDDGSFATTTTSGTITDTPPPGGVYWFLVTATNGSGEGTPGTATAGARLQNLNGTCLPTCALAGQSCSIDADCCSASCVAGTCQTLCCQPTTAFCATNSDCCSGSCSGNQCQAPCTVASQCPGSDTDCQVRTCTSGTCGVSYTLAGTPTSSQLPGDCSQTVCDGSGNITSVIDNNDIPADDGNQCTGETCVSGTPSHPATPLNSPCSQSGGSFCNGSGACVQCVAASQCPGSDTECRSRTCTSFTCGFSFAPAGTVVAGQSPGDCQENQCDGSGNTVTVVDNNDLPADDGNQCTNDVCVSGTPSHPPKPLNSPCSQNGGQVCGSTGTCVECNSSSQCPGTDTDCHTRTCTSGTCGMSFAPSGTVTGGQTPGDCHTLQCDGVGSVVNVVDGADVPFDDGNQCTGEACISGVPSHPASPVNSPCSQSGGTACDGAGNCVNPPQVVSTVPADGAAVPASTTIAVTFSQAMNPATLSGQTSAGACSGSIQVSLDAFVSCVAFSSAAPTMSGGNTVATLAPQPGLLVNRVYKIRVTTAAQNGSGVSLASTFTQGTGFATTSPNLCDGSLVISQLYGGSNVTGSTYRNDFIELHNRGTSAISLAGMSIQYASAAGTTWLQTNLSGSIPAGGYFLIQEFGGATGAALPTPDLTASGSGLIDMSGTTGKLALVANQIALSGACPLGPTVIDFIGYGSSATCNEGGSNAPSGSTTSSISRQQAGCADLNVNGTDITAGTPIARNSGSAPNVCACVARNESNTAAEADFCFVIFPQSLSAQTGTSTGSIFGQLFEAGVTETAGPAAIVRAQLGYGLPTVNPEYQPGFTWVATSYNIQSGNNDEYSGSFTAPAAGSYRYAYRFSVDAGVSWTYCDGTQGDGGAGSNAGLTFDLTTLPVLTVTP